MIRDPNYSYRLLCVYPLYILSKLTNQPCVLSSTTRTIMIIIILIKMSHRLAFQLHAGLLTAAVFIKGIGSKKKRPNFGLVK